MGVCTLHGTLYTAWKHAHCMEACTQDGSMYTACRLALWGSVDKLQVRGESQDYVFSFKSGCVNAMHLPCYEVKRHNLKLKTLAQTTFRSSPFGYHAPQ